MHDTKIPPTESSIRFWLSDRFYPSLPLYQLLIIGEATKRTSQEFRKQHLDIPWSLIADMRDNLIHIAITSILN